MANKDIDSLKMHIEEILANAEPRHTNCCIYKVPHEIWTLKKDAYTPKVVSIGPFHYGNPNLKNMEIHKVMLCKKFIQRIETSLDSLVRCVKEYEPQVRESYSENIKFSKDEFVKMILVDSCFIIETFLVDFFSDESVPFKSRSEFLVTLDFLLLENQLPFFILEEIYNQAFPSHSHGSKLPSIELLTFSYFREYNTWRVHPTVGMKHFTDLFRMFQLPPIHSRPERKYALPKRFYSATELSEARIKLKINKECLCLSELKLSDSCLEIPVLEVSDHIETMFRNLIALEQCHYSTQYYFTDYIVFFGSLVNTYKDVDILVQEGIIKNRLSNNVAVAKMFNGLCKNIVQGDFNFEYFEICQKVDNYCKSHWNIKRVVLICDYFKDRWQAITSIAQVLIVILAIVQTVCALIKVLWAKKS